MFYLVAESLSGLIAKYSTELIIIGSVICLLLLILIYLTFFRKRHIQKMELLPKDQLLEKRSLQPTKEEILSTLAEFNDYPSFVHIMTEVLNHFSLDYLYSYSELAQAFKRMVDFPTAEGGLSSAQRAAMVTIVRVFITSDFIREKCASALDHHFDLFMEEAAKTY